MTLPARKTIRLDAAAYSEPGRAFSITIGTSPRLPIFADHVFGHECIEILRHLGESGRFRVYAFCLMPDHVHMLIAPSSGNRLPRIIGQWKSLCYRSRRARGKTEPFWQRSFYDHGLRRDEDLQKAARYILENPVRAGIVADFHSYPLCGSFEFNL